GFSRAGALPAIPGIRAGIREGSGEIGVAGARPRNLAAPALRIGSGIRFWRHDVLPVPPVAVPDQHGDGGAEGLAGTNAVQPLDVIGLDFHARAAAVPGHAPLTRPVH